VAARRRRCGRLIRQRSEAQMDAGTRACIAYIVGRSISGANSSHVYDYSRSRYVSIDGSVIGDAVTVYDYDRGCHFSGGLSSCYDYGRGAHVSIEISGNNFSGYDYGTGCHYSGSVTGTSISLYDYGDGAYFDFSL
jgi:diadenosine tetraphosphatase ApaH/serine/threonine PP2A family protein phosphatase